MPLLLMDPNIQETEPAGRKRSHGEFSDDTVKAEPDAGVSTAAPVLPPVLQDCTASPPDGSPALNDAGCSTATPQSHSPRTPSKVLLPRESKDDTASASPKPSPLQTTSASKPPIKRKRLTPQEKEDRHRDLAEKKREREAQATLRAAEKARQEEQKAIRAKERDEKRKKKEEEDRVKAEKKRKRDEDQQRIKAEKDKKARTQTRLDCFRMPSTPNKTATGSGSGSASPIKIRSAAPESKSPPSVYEQLFKPFFVKTNTRWTNSTLQMDQQTLEAKSQILDDFISGRREPENPPTSFDAMEMLRLPCKIPRRGRLYHPVSHIMEMAGKEAETSGNAGRAASNDVLDEARRKLAKVPMKVIAFSQDVRPPYYGTLTFKPFALGLANMCKQARRSSHRRLPLDYDYDSEAEWQDEEGEDVDVDDDDDEQDDEDDMDGFLDDSEDAGLARRIFANTMEPESSGVRFENEAGVSDGMLDEYKMEFMHERTCAIDPWSAQYWEQEQKKTAKSEGVAMAPPPAPGNALEDAANDAESDARKLVKAELWDDMKTMILENKALNKSSIVDIIFHRLPNSVSRVEVKNTIEWIAEKKGPGRGKEWHLKPDPRLRG